MQINIRKILIFILKIYFNNKIYKKIKQLSAEARLPKFKKIGKNTIIQQPFSTEQANRIEIGEGCRIGKMCEFGIVKSDGYEGQIIIGNYVYITSRCQIYSSVKIEIEDYVLIASNVFIVDCSHRYSNTQIPYNLQGFQSYSNVKIGKGSWISQNVVIMSGVKIGEQCIIGANSVVNKSIPDRCIAVGSPAKVIKTWNEEINNWVKV